MKPLEVVFCGNSIYLCGLAANLRENPELRVSIVDEGLNEGMPEIKVLAPDVVIFEAAPRVSAEGKNLCDKYADMLIITVDSLTDSLDVFAAGWHFSAPLNDLAQVIRELAGRKDRNKTRFQE